MNSDKKIELLARGVARLFKDDTPVACACIHDCEHLGCEQNWKMLLKNPNRLERLLRVGMAVERIYYV